MHLPAIKGSDDGGGLSAVLMTSQLSVCFPKELTSISEHSRVYRMVLGAMSVAHVVSR
jgi:hypothetical protein